jgi:hypothetical protein
LGVELADHTPVSLFATKVYSTIGTVRAAAGQLHAAP